MTTHQTTIETIDPYGRPTAKALADILSRAANTFTPHFEEVAEHLRNDHRTLQQSMANLAFEMILAFAKNGDEGWVDGRNEFSVELCQEVRLLLQSKGLIKPTDGSLYKFPCI